MSRLLKLYPRRWRQRYEGEVLAVIDQGPLTLADRFDLLLGAVSSWSHAAARARQRSKGGHRSRHLLLQAFMGLLLATAMLLAGNLAPAHAPGPISAAPGYPTITFGQTDHVYQLTFDNIGEIVIPHLVVELRSLRPWKALSVSTSPHRAVRTVSTTSLTGTWDFGRLGNQNILRIRVQFTSTTGGSRRVLLNFRAYENTTRTGQPDPASQMPAPCTAIFVKRHAGQVGGGPSRIRVTHRRCTG